MTKGNCSVAVSICLALLASLGRASQKGDEARELLARSMERSKQIPVVAILYQRSIGGPSAAMQVKVEQKDGNIKVTILQPLSMAGVTSVDDGKNWRTYLPEQNRMLVQQSPRLQAQSVRDRMALADQNYRLTIEKDVSIAGRRAACIAAMPKVKDMPIRRYYIDRETAILLRLETTVEKNLEVQLDTKHIRFPKDMGPVDFQMKFFGDQPRRIDCPSPLKIASAPMAKPNLGFVPSIPHKLPMGFVVQQPQIAGGQEFRFAAIRLTDGLVNGTVYQWTGNPDELPKAFRPQKGDKQAKGVWFRFVGDLPEQAKDQLLELFVREALKNTRLMLEPEAPHPMFKGLRNDLMGLVMLSMQIAAAEAQTGMAGMCAYSRNAKLL